MIAPTPVDVKLRQEPRLLSFALEDVAERLASLLPEQTGKALEELAEEVEKQVVLPLLRARGPGVLGRTFQRLRADFELTYLIVGALTWKALQRKALPWLWQLNVATRQLIADRGPGTFGEQATYWATLGLEATSLINRAIAQQMSSDSPAVQQLPDEPSNRLMNSIISYNMANTAVVAFLNGVERTRPARSNAQILARWSYEYAIGAYQAAKEAGLLVVPVPDGELPSDDGLGEAGESDGSTLQ
ncbi:MAG: hypothetical protein Q8P22_02910 [Chloroflexota bacterium]|nr:hypothetical protein [Chloroflexota bacterium]